VLVLRHKDITSNTCCISDTAHCSDRNTVQKI